MITVGSADAETSGKVRHAAPLSRPLGGRPCTCAENSAREGLELGSIQRLSSTYYVPGTVRGP